MVTMITAEELSQKSAQEIFVLICALHQQLQDKENEISQLRHHLNLLLQNTYGRKSEQMENLPSDELFNEAESADPSGEAIPEVEEASESIRKKPGRKPLPREWPRRRQEYDLPDEEKICHCGCSLTKIGEELSEQLEFIPAHFEVIEHARFKYACKKCEETIKTAQGPLSPIPKSVASPTLLAYILVSKFQDHLPLYRQEQMFNRIGIDLPRNTLSAWVIRCGERLHPLWEAMKKIQIQYDIGYADETPVQVLKEKERPAESRSYMWLFVGGSPEQRTFIYEYQPTRGQCVPKAHWQGFQGYLHTDGYAAYTALFSTAPIQGVHCWAHARRKFVDIIKANPCAKTGLSHWAVAHIAKLYRIEREAKEKGLLPDAIKQLRQERATPLLEEMKDWLDKNIDRTLPRSPIGKALAYCLKYWNNLIRYLEDGRLDIDNNLSERAIKPFATGRKNWLFADTPRGAHAAAVIFSLIETCKAHHIEPYTYLKTILQKIPYSTTEQDYFNLLPFHFKFK